MEHQLMSSNVRNISFTEPFLPAPMSRFHFFLEREPIYGIDIKVLIIRTQLSGHRWNNGRG